MFSIFLSWFLFLNKAKLCIRRLFNIDNTNVRIGNDDEALKSLFQNKKPGKIHNLFNYIYDMHCYELSKPCLKL